MIRMKIDNWDLMLDSIDQFLTLGDELATLIGNCPENMLCVEPERLEMQFHEIYNLWKMYIDTIKYTDTNIRGMDESCDKMKYLNELFSRTFHAYKISGTSGNSENIRGLCEWQRCYSRDYENIRYFIYELRQIVEHVSSMETMSMVYASPELMITGSVVDNRKEQYPFLHADIIDENLMHEDSMMGEVYGSPDMMFDLFEKNDLKAKTFENNASKKTGTFCIYCGKKYSDQNAICISCGKKNIMIEDPEITVKFCRNCDMAVPMIAKYCTWCGKLADVTEDTKKSSKTNIFTKLFKGNK